MKTKAIVRIYDYYNPEQAMDPGTIIEFEDDERAKAAIAGGRVTEYTGKETPAVVLKKMVNGEKAEPKVTAVAEETPVKKTTPKRK